MQSRSPINKKSGGRSKDSLLSPAAFSMVSDPLSMTMRGEDDDDATIDTHTINRMLQDSSLYNSPSGSISRGNVTTPKSQGGDGTGSSASATPKTSSKKGKKNSSKSSKKKSLSKIDTSDSGEGGGSNSGSRGAKRGGANSKASTPVVRRSPSTDRASLVTSPGMKGNTNTPVDFNDMPDEGALDLEDYRTLCVRFIPIPFHHRTCIAQVLISNKLSNVMTVLLRSTEEPFEVLAKKETPMDKIFEMVSVSGSDSVFNDTAIITDIATMKQTFNKMFLEVDSDGNGYLTFDEFMALMDKTKLGIEQKDLRKILMEADDNGNGVVEFDEFYPLILDMTLSYRTMNAAKVIVSKRELIMEDEINHKMHSIDIDELSDAMLMKITSCDPKKSGVVRIGDLKRSLVSISGQLDLSEDEMATIMRFLPREGLGRIRYAKCTEALRHAKWLSMKYRMQEELGSDVYRYLLTKCQAIDNQMSVTRKDSDLNAGKFEFQRSWLGS